MQSPGQKALNKFAFVAGFAGSILAGIAMSLGAKWLNAARNP